MMGRKKIWFSLSLALLLPEILSLFVWKLNLGLDFRGGSLSQDEASGQTADNQKRGSEVIRSIYRQSGFEPIIQDDRSALTARWLVKTKTIEPSQHNDIVRRLGESEPKIAELSFESIDPQVGAAVTRRAILAIVTASLAIIGYIAASFRGVPRPTSSLAFGLVAVIALLHDVGFIIGFYSIMGHFFGWEVNSEFVTAALTVMGFSVHDTIVVFDRLRENLKRGIDASFSHVADLSVAQTVARSLNTSLTVIVVLFALALLGGTVVRPFVVTLLVGIAVGTYSSIFVATPLLDSIHNWRQKIGQRQKIAD